MKIRSVLLSLLLTGITTLVPAQDYYEQGRAWVAMAEQLKPALHERQLHPVAVIEPKRNPAAFQGWEARVVASPDSVYENSFRNIGSVILDFGEHLTGYFSFDLETLWGTSDAPLRFRLTFGEILSEVAEPLDPYEGALSRAWLQDEVVTVMPKPGLFTWAVPGGPIPGWFTWNVKWATTSGPKAGTTGTNRRLNRPPTMQNTVAAVRERIQAGGWNGPTS